LIEFTEPLEARMAFKGLAYRKYKHIPLYLEWAPLGIMGKARAPVEKRGKEKKVEEEDAGDDDYGTLFLKNLSFDTSEDALRAFISCLDAAAGLRTISIPTKTRGDARLPMGFAFVEYASPHAARAAQRVLDGATLDGHALEVRPSDKRLTGTPAVPRGEGTGRKLVVRNVAFQATKAEIRALFAAFGVVERVRLPRKLGGVHRGFAFVEMASSREAAAAAGALAHSHLYGRRLVIDWAGPSDQEDPNEITGLRKRARADERVISSNSKRQGITEGRGNDLDDIPSNLHEII
jgi:multiple RNA-binding domain-containing protein 1